MAFDLRSLGVPSKIHHTTPGASEDNPFIIVGIFTSRALGDFTLQNIIAASIKKQFEHARLYVYCREDRKYKKDIINMNSHIDWTFYMAENGSLALDNFGYFGDMISMGWKAPGFVTRHKAWHENNCNAPHLILSPSMMHETLLTGFESPARLTISDRKSDALTNRLVEKGLDPARWFSVIHYREPSYNLRPARQFRDVAHAPFQTVTNRIIRDLDGQVVRVGHPGMARFSKQDGFVDLSEETESAFELQAFAISRARFMLAVSSGPLQVASAFGTPAASTNAINPAEVPGCWNVHDLCLHRNLFLADGTRILAEDAMEHGLFDRQRLMNLVHEKRLTVMENSPDELFEIARLLHGETSRTNGWRVPVVEPKPGYTPPNCFFTPCKVERKVRVTEFPDLARTAFETRKVN